MLYVYKKHGGILLLRVTGMMWGVIILTFGSDLEYNILNTVGGHVQGKTVWCGDAVWGRKSDASWLITEEYVEDKGLMYEWWEWNYNNTQSTESAVDLSLLSKEIVGIK